MFQECRSLHLPHIYFGFNLLVVEFSCTRKCQANIFVLLSSLKTMEWNCLFELYLKIKVRTRIRPGSVGFKFVFFTTSPKVERFPSQHNFVVPECSRPFNFSRHTNTYFLKAL